MKNSSRFTNQVRALLVGILLISSVGVMSLPNTKALADPGCILDSPGSKIKHVIYLQFDNVHLKRDNPNVPSDLEQMPHLLNFIKDNGVMSGNHHTPLISHTADDILTSETGVYGDRHGQPVSNSFGYFSSSGTKFASSFTYWTDPVSSFDTQYSLLNSTGQNAPAPWVAYTRAGCNFGAAALANMEVENTGSDLKTIFGVGSPQAIEGTSHSANAVADFEGIAIHCAAGDPLCSAANGGVPDVLPQEKGGYSGYNALFGHKYVAPQISSTLPMKNLNGNTINGSNGIPGFPGFDGMSANVTLSYVAQMQEKGIPVTYAYISDAHDNHKTFSAFGPGEAGYVAALQSYDRGFDAFFKRLNTDGINPTNTLFVITSDENDHFVGGAPTPTNCDGVTISCTYTQIGEIDANLQNLLASQGITTPFAIHFDDAPNFYIHDNPTRTNSTVRAFEQATGKLTAVNPITGNTDKLMVAMADPVEEKLLHMVTADPQRTPTFTMFGDPDYFYETSPSSPTVFEAPAFAWNHGDVQPEITTTWLGMAGPGIKHLGLDNNTWSDHTDIRPTMLMLLGLQDDYTHDGRALVEDIKTDALPHSIKDHNDSFEDLATVYKQINAPVGKLGLCTLQVSTQALNSTTSGDANYNNLENKLVSITNNRDTLKGQIINVLDGAEFGGQTINPHQVDALTDKAHGLLDKVTDMCSTDKHGKDKA
ncbi:MAG: hypothetical protein KGI28_01515 [Thaumarchaeota archaeon]|nr:hypothetical protein [Nitrososphaerota archaeon]